jgi:hypothetical protein
MSAPQVRIFDNLLARPEHAAVWNFRPRAEAGRLTGFVHYPSL